MGRNFQRGPGDLARVSPVKNADLPDQISPGLIKGAEYTSSAAIVQHAKVIKSLGLQWIGFDFESAAGFGKPEDLANPIAAIRTASNAAHGAGLLFACALDKVLGAQLGAQIATYCDLVNYQGQSLLNTQGVQAYANYVIPLATKSKQLNPDSKVISQISTRAGNLQILQLATNAVIQHVDIIAVWPDVNKTPNTIPEISQYVRWFKTIYHG